MVDTSSTGGYVNREAIMMSLKYSTGIKSGILYNNLEIESQNKENTKKTGFLKGLVVLLRL